MWLHWQPQARLCWIVAGLLLVVSWAGMVLQWGLLAGQLVALREAITGLGGIGIILMQALPVWDEGTLFFPTIAGVGQFFRPQPLVRPARMQLSAQPTLPAKPKASMPLTGMAERLTLPSPAVKPDAPPQETAQLAS